MKHINIKVVDVTDEKKELILSNINVRKPIKRKKPKLKVSKHAITRFRERVLFLSEFDIVKWLNKQIDEYLYKEWKNNGDGEYRIGKNKSVVVIITQKVIVTIIYKPLQENCITTNELIEIGKNWVVFNCQQRINFYLKGKGTPINFLHYLKNRNVIYI